MALNYTELMVLIWILYGASFVVTAGRAIERFSRHKTFQVEDYIIFFGLATLTGLSIVITIMTPKFINAGDLLRQAAVDPTIMITPQAVATLQETRNGLKMMFSQMFLFFTALFAAKFSLLFFFRRLIIGLPRYMWLWMLTLAIITILYLASMASNLLTCTPLDKYWSSTGCSSLDDRRKADKSIRFATGADIAADGLIMLLPLNLLRQLQLGRTQKAGLAGIFTVGFIIIVFSIVRLIEVTQATQAVQTDPTKLADSPIKLSAWSHIEASVSIIVASLPTFRFLRVKTGTRKSSAKSPNDRARDIGASLHTIGSGGGRVKRSNPDDSLFETLVDEEYCSAKELNTLYPTERHGSVGANEGITKKVDYMIREEIVQKEPQRPRQSQQAQVYDHEEYRSRFRDSALPIQSNAL